MAGLPPARLAPIARAGNCSPAGIRREQAPPRTRVGCVNPACCLLRGALCAMQHRRAAVILSGWKAVNDRATYFTLAMADWTTLLRWIGIRRPLAAPVPQGTARIFPVEQP